MRQLLYAVAALAMLGGAPMARAADTPAPVGFTIVHLNERAVRLMPRDHLRAGLAVEVTGPVPQQVQAEINRRMDTALQKARQVSTVKPETGGYSVYQQREPNKPVVWHGQQTLNLSSDAPADLLALMGDLQQQGLNTVGLGFEVAPDTLRKAQDGLTAEALTALRQRAERVASELGLGVQQIRDLTVGNAESGVRPPMPMAMMRSAGAAAPPVAEPGDAEVSVTVQAEVWLAPKSQ
jgi:uncharacterized protein